MAKVDARLAEKPEDGGLWFQRAVLQFEHEDYPAAAVDFAKAEKFAPGKFTVLWWQGRILEAEGKYAGAKVELDRCLGQAPDHWGALASRGRVHHKLGLNQEALADFRSALEKCSDPGLDLYSEVAAVLATNGCIDEAVTTLEGGLEKKGPIPSLQLQLLKIEVDAERYDKALVRLSAYERSAPRKEPWMERRAIILAQAGSVAESQGAWRALVHHLKRLPPVERDSHAMVLLAERSRLALASSPVLTFPSSTPFKNTPNPHDP